MKVLQSALLALFLAAMLSSIPLLAADDPLSGAWTGDWGPSATHRNQGTVELKWDGKTLTGAVNPGPNAIELKKATFDAKTNAIHLEADASSRRGGKFTTWSMESSNAARWRAAGTTAISRAILRLQRRRSCRKLSAVNE
jgi:hypothetical protein